MLLPIVKTSNPTNLKDFSTPEIVEKCHTTKFNLMDKTRGCEAKDLIMMVTTLGATLAISPDAVLLGRRCVDQQLQRFNLLWLLQAALT